MSSMRLEGLSSDAGAHLRFRVDSRWVRSVSFEFKPPVWEVRSCPPARIGVDRASRHDVAIAAACSIAMDRSGVKRKARYSIFSRRDDGSLLLDTSATPSSSDDARTPAPVGRPFRSGLLLTVVVIVALLAIPKIFHITVTLPKVGCMGMGEVPAWGGG